MTEAKRGTVLPLAGGQDGKEGISPVFDALSEQGPPYEALRKSEERYRLLAENVSDLIFIISLQLRLSYISPSVTRAVGFSPEEMLTISLESLLTPDSLKLVTTTLMEEFALEENGGQDPSRVRTLQLEANRKDGSKIWLESKTTFLRGPDDKPCGILGVARDISDRKKAEDALRESESKYRQLVKHAPAGIYEVDLLNRKFITVNDVMCEYTGFTREEFFSLNPLELMSDESRNLFLERMAKVFAGEKVPESVEYKIRGKNGREFWVVLYTRYFYENGILKSAMVIVHDSTERKQAEEALWKSQERYRLLVDHATEGIFIWQGGKIKFANPRMQQLLGYSMQELTNTSFASLVHKEDLPLFEEWNRQGSTSGAVTPSSSLRFINKAGEELWVQMDPVGITWDGLPASLNFLRDITLQKKLEVQLLRAEKMEAIGTLAGGIAHNFNNLLMGIQGNAFLAIMDTPADHPHYEKLKNIERLVESGSRLTGQLLGYARGGKYTSNPLNLNQVITETAHTFGLTKKEITLHQDLAKDLLTIVADRGQIEEVLMNLFVNAADAMQRGGDLYLKTGNTTHKDLMGKAFEVIPGEYVLLTVKDTGIGMDAKTMERAFDPFFTTKEVGRGTGLGLASVYGIVKSHGGYIDVESSLGEGTTFSIYFPGSRLNRVEEPLKEKGLLKGNETILLVDDEEMIVGVAEQILSTLGYRVLTAKCGKEALDLYKTEMNRIGLVILDMIMPEMGGGEIYERMKEMNPRVKALLASGYNIDGRAMEILDQGCDGFIQKPFRIGDLARKMREILDKN
jgi:two-component system cell cycle sensor histidine kinase/response regulator CckA